MNIAFANPDANGQITVPGSSFVPIVEQAHDAGAEVFIALAASQATWPDWEFWLAPDNRSTLIHNLINFTLSNNLQGIDVDLEFSYVNDDYSGFVVELRDSIDNYELELSAALPGSFRYSEVTDEALASFDWINLMVYNLTGPWAPDNPGRIRHILLRSAPSIIGWGRVWKKSG